jgi:hypothetical protein
VHFHALFDSYSGAKSYRNCIFGFKSTGEALIVIQDTSTSCCRRSDANFIQDRLPRASLARDVGGGQIVSHHTAQAPIILRDKWVKKPCFRELS